MQDSQALKDKGNQCFASNDFANAISFYSQGILNIIKNKISLILQKEAKQKQNVIKIF